MQEIKNGIDRTHLYIDRDLTQRRDDVERRTSLDVQVARPHTVDALAGRRRDDLRAGMDHEPQSAARNDPPDGMLRADAVEIHGTGGSIERDGAADMRGSVRLEDLAGERTQVRFEEVAIGRLLVDVVEPFEVDIGLTERRDFSSIPPAYRSIQSAVSRSSSNRSMQEESSSHSDRLPAMPICTRSRNGMLDKKLKPSTALIVTV